MDTRELLLVTAERLYGERGLNGVSLREIVRAAGQRNASAAHYHFGSRDGLIEAIFEKRMSMLDRRRMELLDELETAGEAGDLHRIADCIVRPLVELLLRDDEASYYVRFLSDMFLSHEFRVDDYVEGKFNHGMRRAFHMIQDALPDLPPQILKQRFLLSMHAAVFSLADIDAARTRREAAGGAFDMDRAIGNLIDMWVGGLTAPVSKRAAARLQAA